MIKLFYHFLIFCYTGSIRIASLTNSKAKNWIHGRKGILKKIRNDLEGIEKTIWIHCASLGEFEQGRPVIEEIKKLYPKEIVVLTFFSPSGYEIRKNYALADFVYYLPADTYGKAQSFLQFINPKLVLFVKYEFWFGYLSALKKKKIPAYLISAKFKQDHYLFKWYGKIFLNYLRAFNTIFVQDQVSYNLLINHRLNAIVTGDTRFDRVKSIAENCQPNPIVEKFLTGNNYTIIGGSTWPPEETMIAQLAQLTFKKVKWIIAPHDVSSEHIMELTGKFGKDSVLYSSLLNPKNAPTGNVLIIDCIGILSQLYQYGKIAIIGGGFGNGIHNTQEAIVYGIPVLFGPKYKKFQEAVDLVNSKGAFTFSTLEGLTQLIHELIENETLYENARTTAKNYVQRNLGATGKVLNLIRSHFN